MSPNDTARLRAVVRFHHVTQADWRAAAERQALELVFSHRPTDPARLAEIERLFNEEGIAVAWEDETMAERRARADSTDAQAQ